MWVRGGGLGHPGAQVGVRCLARSSDILSGRLRAGVAGTHAMTIPEHQRAPCVQLAAAQSLERADVGGLGKVGTEASLY